MRRCADCIAHLRYDDAVANNRIMVGHRSTDDIFESYRRGCRCEYAAYLWLSGEKSGARWFDKRRTFIAGLGDAVAWPVEPAGAFDALRRLAPKAENAPRASARAPGGIIGRTEPQ